MKQNSVSRKKLKNTNQNKGITNKTKEKKTKHKSNNSNLINKTIKSKSYRNFRRYKCLCISKIQFV